MLNNLARIALALLRAAHLGPTLLVVIVTFFLALSVFSWVDSLRIALAIFAGQLVVGWSNDLIDYPLDKAAQRFNKPLVAGKLEIGLLKKAIPVALVLAFMVSYASPLGLRGTLLHFLGILSATVYNFKLKSTVFSPLSYIISFGTLPWAIYLAADRLPPIWLYLCFIVFSTSFHFLNVLKDLDRDLDQGIYGMPQRIGRNRSIMVAAILALIGLITLLWFS